MNTRLLGLAGCALLLTACNGPSNDELSKPVTPDKPPIQFDLTATAKRIDAKNLLLEVTDRSQDGARVMAVRSPSIDTFQDKDGNPIRATLREYKLGLPQQDSLNPDASFVIQMLFQGTFPDEIGRLSGVFEALVGDAEEMTLRLEPDGFAATPKMEQLGIQVSTEFQTIVKLGLEGESLSKCFLVIGEGKEENTHGGYGWGGNSAERTWTLNDPPNDQQEIRLWKSENDREQTPAWTIHPIEPGPVSNEELGLSGEIRFSRNCNIVVKGPKDILVSARLVDSTGQVSDLSSSNSRMSAQRPLYQTLGNLHQWVFKTSQSNVALQIRICENAIRASELLEFENLQVEAPQ